MVEARSWVSRINESLRKVESLKSKSVLKEIEIITRKTRENKRKMKSAGKRGQSSGDRAIWCAGYLKQKTDTDFFRPWKKGYFRIYADIEDIQPAIFCFKSKSNATPLGCIRLSDIKDIRSAGTEAERELEEAELDAEGSDSDDNDARDGVGVSVGSVHGQDANGDGVEVSTLEDGVAGKGKGKPGRGVSVTVNSAHHDARSKHVGHHTGDDRINTAVNASLNNTITEKTAAQINPCRFDIYCKDGSAHCFIAPNEWWANHWVRTQICRHALYEARNYR